MTDEANVVHKETLEAIAKLTEVAAKLDSYYLARKALEYVVEHSTKLRCECPFAKGRGYVIMHENFCPIGYAINTLSDTRDIRDP